MRRGINAKVGGERRGSQRQLAKDPVVHEAFDMLKEQTVGGPRLHVRDLGELLYLVTHVSFTKARLASVLKVVDPVYEVEYLDEPQCQFVVERVRNVLRAEDMQRDMTSTSNKPQRNFHLPGELETPDFECCNCTLPSACTTLSSSAAKQGGIIPETPQLRSSIASSSGRGDSFLPSRNSSSNI
mmetsp:Transcript_23908/g.31116  ORF Transcript_23908/g.31116 Transcript_23908/m.31116 type:complete len:184 (+) Transcript_23908:363-914(+)